MRGLFPGRFQPFQEGHRQFVEAMAAELEEVIVGVGSAQASHTGRTPFTAGERVSMVYRTLAGLATTTCLIPIEDIDRYAVWPAHVRAQCPPFEAIYTNNPLVGRVCREAGFDVRAVELFERDRYRGTEIRARIVEGEPWRDLVPDPAVEILEEIDGPARLRAIAEHDEHSVGAAP